MKTKTIHSKALKINSKKCKVRKQKKTAGTEKASRRKSRLNTKKYVKTAITLTVIFAIAVILLANVFIVKEE